MRRIAIAVALALAASVSLAACGGTSSHFECCVNGAYYACADQAAFDSCSTTNNTCTPDPSKDASCGR